MRTQSQNNDVVGQTSQRRILLEKKERIGRQNFEVKRRQLHSKTFMDLFSFDLEVLS